jgi:hypothetical protein
VSTGTPSDTAITLAVVHDEALVIEKATPQGRRRFLAGVPLPPRMLLKVFGSRR